MGTATSSPGDESLFSVHVNEIDVEETQGKHVYHSDIWISFHRKQVLIGSTSRHFLSPFWSSPRTSLQVCLFRFPSTFF